MKIFIILIHLSFLLFGSSSFLNSNKLVAAVDSNITNISPVETVSTDISIMKEELSFLLLNIKNLNYLNYNESYTSELNKLSIRISVNKNKKFNLAVERDSIKISLIENNIFYISFINQLIDSRKEFKNSTFIEKTIFEFQESLHRPDTFKFSSEKNIIAKSLNSNLDKLTIEYNSYILKSKFLLKNLKEIETDNLFIKYVNTTYFIEYINNIKIFMYVNPYIQYFIKLDMGRIILSGLSVIFILLLRKIIVPFFMNIYSKYTPKLDSSDHIEFKGIVKKKIFFSVNIVLWVLSIQVALEILSSGVFSLEVIREVAKIIYVFSFLFIIHILFNGFIEIYSENLISKYPQARKEIILFFNRLVNILFILIFITFLLTIFGINLSAIIGGIGVLSIGISLALKDTFSNFIGTVNIIFDQSFNTGDWIATSNYEGTVIEVGMRKTRIRSFGNQEWSVPNSLLSNEPILNHSQRKIGRRIKMSLGLTYSSKPEDLKSFVFQLKESLKNNKDIATERSIYSGVGKSSRLIIKEDDLGIKRTLLVFVDSLNDYSINVLVYAFSESVKWEKWLEVKESLIFDIMRLVQSNNLEFAFPTQVNIIENNKLEV